MNNEKLENAVVDALLEFLEAAVHTLLKSRSVYSEQLFENRRLYGITVSQCRHPDVCSYIGTVLSSLKPLLLKDTLQELVVAFYDKHGAPISKVSFILQGFNCQAQAVNWPALEPSFRSSLLKLHFSDNLLKPLPEGSTFELVAVATSRVGVIPQVLAEESDLQSITLQQPAAGIPLNACTLPGVLSMQVVLEETAAAADTDAASGAGATTEEADLTQPAG